MQFPPDPSLGRSRLQEISARIDQLRAEIASLEGVLEGFPTPEQSAHAQQLVGHLRNATVRNELAARQSELVDLNRQAAALADDVPVPAPVSSGLTEPSAPQMEVPASSEPAPVETPAVEADATVALEPALDLGEATLQMAPEPLPTEVRTTGPLSRRQAEAARESSRPDAAEETLEFVSPGPPGEQGLPAVEQAGGESGADQPIAPAPQVRLEPPEAPPTWPVLETGPEEAAASEAAQPESVGAEPTSQDRISRFISGVGTGLSSEVEPSAVSEVTEVAEDQTMAEMAAMVNIPAVADVVEPAGAQETNATLALPAVSKLPDELMPAEEPTVADVPAMPEEPTVADMQAVAGVPEMAETPAATGISPVAAPLQEPEIARRPERTARPAAPAPAAVSASPLPTSSEAPAAAVSGLQPVRLVEPARRRRKLALIGLAAAAVLVVGAGGFMLMGRGEPSAPSVTPTAPAAGPGANATPVVAVATQPALPPTSAPTAAVPTAVPTRVPTEVPTPAPAQVSSAPEPTAEAEPEPEVAIEAAPDLPVGTIQAPGFASVNLRRSPSSSAPSIRAVPVGTRVEILEGRTTADGRTWQQVRTPQGEEGWILADTVAR